MTKAVYSTDVMVVWHLQICQAAPGWKEKEKAATHPFTMKALRTPGKGDQQLDRVYKKSSMVALHVNHQMLYP